MKILIGYDGSDSADAAIRDLVRAGLPDDVDAIVLTVAEQYTADPADSILPGGGSGNRHRSAEGCRTRPAVASGSGVGVMDLRQFIPARDLAPTLLDDLVASENAERDWLQRAVDAACDTLRKAGLIVQGEVVDGDPGKVLLETAEEWGADSIVLGARGVSGLQRFVLGSVSYAVCARAHCSVEVARTTVGTDRDR